MSVDSTVETARARTREVTARFDDEYWRTADQQRAYPQEFVDAMGASGLLAAMIPTDHGGLGWGIGAASAVMEEINASGGHSAACHAQMYTMGAVLRHGNEKQKRQYLPAIASGDLRLQAFSITESSGSDTSRIETVAELDGDDYVITGHKTWTSRIEESDLALVLARTSPRGERPTEGMTLFLIDLREVRATSPEQLEVIPVRTMFNYATNQVRYHGLRVPASAVLGTVGKGFRHVIDGWNAERILLAAEAVGDSRWFVDRAVSYSQEREIFGRPLAVNQGVQFPIADAYIRLRAADGVRWEACELFDADQPCGAEANMAKWLAAEASWQAANTCLDTYGGFGFVDTYDVERKFRETRIYGVAPVSSNMIRSFIATKVLGLPKSY
ncbi:acyl-CoA dehydrogenase family protein [Serinicoccus marinus]|uniref:acyl-CoA dehydrogenase family protein n=1 Tax=Serinicoccus marinus TaxID=247333 RepID=UPI0024913FA7|nr:acyl-CoA dehydrogenase family protein [Serinicoccus marinus]